MKWPVIMRDDEYYFFFFSVFVLLFFDIFHVGIRYFCSYFYFFILVYFILYFLFYTYVDLFWQWQTNWKSRNNNRMKDQWDKNIMFNDINKVSSCKLMWLLRIKKIRTFIRFYTTLISIFWFVSLNISFRCTWIKI